MSDINMSNLQVADNNMVPAVFRNMKSTITDLYCNRKYQQSAGNKYAKRGDDLDTGLTCASVVLLQTAVRDKDCKWNAMTHSIADWELKRLFHKYIKQWCIYSPGDRQQKELFFQQYLIHEQSKNKFSAGGFISYHLIKFFVPGAIEHLKNYDIHKAKDLLPATIDMAGTHLVQNSLGRSAWAEPFYEDCFNHIFGEMYKNIITFNSFLCHMQDVIANCSTDKHKEDLENAYFFEYKALLGLQKIFQQDINETYLVGIFSKPNWLGQRVKSMMNDLERRKFMEPLTEEATMPIPNSIPADSFGYQYNVDMPKVDTFVASLLLLNV